MKKTYKILVLILSLCLIIGAMVMVVSADDTVTEPVDLSTLISNAGHNDTITLESDAIITTSKGYNKRNLVINLNGHTLTASVADAIKNWEANTTFTINGPGKIVNTGNKFLSSTDKDNVNINIIGTEENPIEVETTHGRFIHLGGIDSTCTFEYVNFTVKATNSNGVFSQNANFNAKYIFNNCTISSSIVPTGDNVYTHNLICVSGDGSLELNNTSITSAYNAIFLKTCTSTGEFIKITNGSQIKVNSEVGGPAAIAGNSDNAENMQGTILIEDSRIESSNYMFNIYCQDVTAETCKVDVKNSTLFHDGQGYSAFAKNVPVYLDATSIISGAGNLVEKTEASLNAIDANTNANTVVFVSEGTKTNIHGFATNNSATKGLFGDDRKAIGSEESLYEFVAGDDGYYTVTLKGSEPEVPEEPFDLSTAITAANDGDTITLPADTTVDLTSAKTITISKNLTLDLGGHTLSFIPNGTNPAFTINTASITFNITGTGTIDLNGGKFVADTDNATAATKINITGTEANHIIITSDCESSKVLFVSRKAEYIFSYVDITVTAITTNGTFQENGNLGGKFVLNNCEITASGATTESDCVARIGGDTGTFEMNNTTVTTDGNFIRLYYGTDKIGHTGDANNPFIKISNSEIICTNASLNSSVIGVSGVIYGTVLIESSALKASYSIFDIDVSAADHLTTYPNSKIICNDTDILCEGDTFAYISNACPVYLDENCTISGTTTNAAVIASNSTDSAYGIFASAGMRIGLEIFATGASENGLRDINGEIINSEASSYEFINDPDGNATLPYVLSLKESTEPEPEPTEPFDLYAALAAAAEGDTITLPRDAVFATAFKCQKYNITVDLNGHTLTMSAAIQMWGDINFTICGQGTIIVDAQFINCGDSKNNPNVKINGTAGIINIQINAAKAVSAVNGTYTFTNTDITVNAVGADGAFTQSTNSLAKFVFQDSDITATTGTGYTSNVICLRGNGQLELNNTSIISPCTAIYLKTCTNTGEFIKILNGSEIKVNGTAGGPTVIGSTTKAGTDMQGTILIKDSYIESSWIMFSLYCEQVSAETCKIVCENATLYHNGVSYSSFVRNVPIYLDGASTIDGNKEGENSIAGKTNASVGAIDNESYANKNTVVFVSEGTKTTLKGLATSTKTTGLYGPDRKLIGSADSSYEFVLDSDGNYVMTVKEGVLLVSGIKANVAVYSDFGVNIYIPAKYELTEISANGEAYEMVEIKLNGEVYNKISIVRKMYHASEEVAITFTAAYEDMILENHTLNIDVVSYAKAVLATYSNDSLEATLMHHILNYAQAANTYYKGKVDGVAVNAEITEILADASFNYYSYTSEIKSYTTEQQTAMTNASIHCTLDIDNETLGYIFTINATDYKEKVFITLDGVRYAPVDGVISIQGLKVYNLIKDITINIDGVECSYHLANIIDYYATEGYEDEAMLVEAFYEYAKCAANYRTSNSENKAEEALDNKRVIFIGNSHTYYGKTVLEKAPTSTLAARENDTGYFYQLCKENGINVEVTNWTFGNHGLGDLFGGACEGTGKDCEGSDHKAVLAAGNTYYDYVVIQPGTGSNATLVENVQSIMSFFQEANPNVKFILVLTNRHYANGYDEGILSHLEALDSMGVSIADWGRLTYDIINGDVTVPGTETTYNQNSFIVSKSSTDGYHPNMLTGYITSLWIYSVITGESAACQPYLFATDTTVNSKFNTVKFKEDYYTYDNENTADVDESLTNFDEILASGNEIGGLQQLIDLYIAEEPYRDAVTVTP